MKYRAVIVVALMLLVPLSAIQVMQEPDNPKIVFPDEILQTSEPVEADEALTQRVQGLDYHFTENRGQLLNDDIQYYFNGDSGIGFVENGILISLPWEYSYPHVNLGVIEQELHTDEVHLTITFEGCNDVSPLAMDPVTHKTNYYLGNDRSKWCTDVPSYKRILYQDVWDDIDIEYVIKGPEIKYNIYVRPGGDIGEITMAVDKLGDLSASTDELMIETSYGWLVDRNLVAFQIIDDNRVEVPVEFSVTSTKTFSYKVLGEYDTKEVLVIDPELVYSTYISTSVNEAIWGMTIDSDNNVYVTGTKNSGPEGSTDGFVYKLNAAGTDLDYKTYIGGSSYDEAHDIAVDGSGNAYVTGLTNSDNFPLVEDADDDRVREEAFAVKLDTHGDFIFSTYLGGSSDDGGYAIALDSNTPPNVYIAGTTKSTDFPSRVNSLSGSADVFVARLDDQGDEIEYVRYIGGSSREVDRYLAIDVDVNKYPYITGKTTSNDFPTTSGCYQNARKGSTDAFITRIKKDFSGLEFSTYLGGSSYETGCDLKLDENRNIYVTGFTESDDFPTSQNAFCRDLSGSSDAYVCKFSMNGAMIASTYIGGTSGDNGASLAVHTNNKIYLTGSTGSDDFPTTSNAYSDTKEASSDVFALILKPDCSDIDYSTYVGGSGADGRAGYGNEIAFDADGNFYVAGQTFSSDFPTTTGAYQTSALGGREGFVFKHPALDGSTPPSMTLIREHAPTLRFSSGEPVFPNYPYDTIQNSLDNCEVFFSYVDYGDHQTAAHPEGFWVFTYTTLYIENVFKYNQFPHWNPFYHYRDAEGIWKWIDKSTGDVFITMTSMHEWDFIYHDHASTTVNEAEFDSFIVEKGGHGILPSEKYLGNLIDFEPNPSLVIYPSEYNLLELDIVTPYNDGTDPWIGDIGERKLFPTHQSRWKNPHGYYFFARFDPKNLLYVRIYRSPEICIMDSQGRTTGLVDGEIVHQIPGYVFYIPDTETIVMLDDVDYQIVVKGDEDEQYDISIAHISGYNTESPTGTMFQGIGLNAYEGLTTTFDVSGLTQDEVVITSELPDGTVEEYTSDTTFSPPIADAGEDLVLNVFEIGTFSGSGSTDSDGTIVTYEWDFGDGSPVETGVETTHAFSDDGIYTVTLTVTDDEGISDTETCTVTVLNNPPEADAGSDHTIYLGTIITLDGLDSSDVDGTIVSYSWDFGDGSDSGSGESVTHEYTDHGSYTVTLTVTDDDGDADTDTCTITVLNNPPVADAGSDQTIYLGNLAYLDASDSSDVDGTIVAYSWDFGDSSPSGSGESVSHEYSDHGTYTVTLTVTDDDGDTDTDTCTITVLNNPPVAIVGDDRILIVGEETTFDGGDSYDVDGTIVSYSWDFGDSSSTGTGSSVIHSYSSAGTYTVTLTVTDDDGDTGTDTLEVTVLTLSEAIDLLIEFMESLDLPEGLENSLDSKLENAQKSLAKDNDNAAVNQLEAFINEVEGQAGKKISESDAAELIEYAEWIIDNI